MTDAPSFALTLDHLVVAARTLEEGRQWCRDALGVDAAGGGKHAGLATHNALLRLGAANERRYLEIIAIDPTAGNADFPRWFGLDSASVQREIALGPRLVAWVARCGGRPEPGDDASCAGPDAAIDALAATPGYAATVVRAASRADLRWRFAFTPDGERIAGGVLPHLIQWDVAVHPCDRLPDSGVRLSSLLLGAPAPEATSAMLTALNFSDVDVHVAQSAAPQLVATLITARGIVTLD